MEVEIRGMSSFFLSITMLCFWGSGQENNGSGNARMLSRFNHVQLLATQWTVGRQAPLSMGFSRQEYWSGLPFPAPGDLPNQGIKLLSLTSPWLALAGRFFTTSATWTVAEQQSRETSSGSSGGHSRDHAQSKGAVVIVITVSGFLPGTMLRAKLSIISLISPTQS